MGGSSSVIAERRWEGEYSCVLKIDSVIVNEKGGIKTALKPARGSGRWGMYACGGI